MIPALQISATADYVCKSDNRTPDGKPLEGATVWHLGAMDSYIESHLASKGTSYEISNPDGEDLTKYTQDELNKFVKVHVDVHMMAIECVRLCVRGWDNFSEPFKTVKADIKGRKYNCIPADIISKIPKDIIIELYGEIQRISAFTADELKNSAAG